MAHELSPDLQKIQDRFMVNYAIGGLPAVEQMVEDLAAEADGARAFADGAQDIEHDAIMNQDTADASETVRTIVMANEVTRDSTTAITQHSFASFLLGVVKEEQ